MLAQSVALAQVSPFQASFLSGIKQSVLISLILSIF